MKVKEIVTTICKTKKRVITIAVVLAVIVLVILYLTTYSHSFKADTTVLNNLLLEASELTTAKLKITNMTEYQDEGIKILNRSDFIMIYDATVWAGIDVKKVEIVPNDLTKVIHINIPKATIQNVKVDSSTIKYFDEGFALFNVNEKEDVNNAVVLAEKAIKEEAISTGILELADKQSATLIEGILSNAIPDGYKIKAEVIK